MPRRAAPASKLAPSAPGVSHSPRLHAPRPRTPSVPPCIHTSARGPAPDAIDGRVTQHSIWQPMREMEVGRESQRGGSVGGEERGARVAQPPGPETARRRAGAPFPTANQFKALSVFKHSGLNLQRLCFTAPNTAATCGFARRCCWAWPSRAPHSVSEQRRGDGWVSAGAGARNAALSHVALGVASVARRLIKSPSVW